MISNVCKIENGTSDLSLILKESEKVAVYNELNAKQTAQLRLLCEEIDGMLPNLIGEFTGEVWIEFLNGVCKINASINLGEFTAEKKEQLVELSKNKQNAMAKGIIGKIRSFIEDTFLDENKAKTYEMRNLFALANEYSTSLDSSYVWSLQGYKQHAVKEENTEEWDELEKSIIASVADDIIVGVKGYKANIVIVKDFN